MSDLDDKISRLEAVREKLTTAERTWLDQIIDKRATSKPVTSREWARVDALAEEAEGRA